MADGFLHGIETVTVDKGPRTIVSARSGIIGVIGTAPAAEAGTFPLDTPVLVTSRGGFADIGATGTLPKALDDIFKQGNAVVIVVRVTAGSDDAATIANIIGSVNSQTDAMTGIYAFKKAETLLGYTPMIITAPGFTGIRPTQATSVTVSAGGTGYTSAPTVTFSGGGTNTAKILPTGHAVLTSGVVTSIVIDTPGRYLDAAPTITFSGGGGSGAAATANVAAGPNPIVSALLPLANAFRAHILAEGPNTTYSAALAYRNDWASRRVFVTDPGLKMYNATSGVYESRPNSAAIAGLIARIDTEKGFWKSPSNEVVNGVGGLDRQIDFSWGDSTSTANLMNENEIATFIKDEGFRLWGNRTCSDNTKFAFLAVSRTADMVDISIAKAHRRAVDEAVTKAYITDVVTSVNNYLRSLKSRGAILGGTCWFDEDDNPPEQIAAGQVIFSYDFTASPVAERLTFKSSVVDDYISSIFS